MVQVTGVSPWTRTFTLMHSFQVWAAVPPWKQGSLAEFVTLTEFEVSSAVALLVSPRLIRQISPFLRCNVRCQTDGTGRKWHLWSVLLGKLGEQKNQSRGHMDIFVS